MCSWWKIFYDSEDFFLCFDDWLYVCFRAVVGSPDRDSSDQVWESVHVVDVFHFIGG